MKTIPYMLLAILASLSLAAQPSESDSPRRGRSSRNPPPAEQRRRPVVDRWLDHLQSEDPDQHARLQELREQDPEAFRGEVRQGLHEARRLRRRRFLERRFQDELDALQNAQSPEEHEAARENLREKATELVDQRMALREQRIQSVRDELEKLEKQHQDDKERRDELIDNLLLQLLEEPHD